MNESNSATYSVAIIGGGPAGLYAARELAERGIHSVIFNRDIKPGGLAEYGIYPTKQKMKEGLRSQFKQILARDEIEYYGNVLIGERGDLSVEDIRNLGFQAILITVGAQSAKRLGIPGEDLVGVHHAKDLVYHYNLLPPFSQTTYHIGKRVAVIGVGNVMVDIAHWLIDEKGVERVIAVARRGPAEVKFDKKELEEVISCLDIGALRDELVRITPRIVEIGQDPMDLLKVVSEVAQKIPVEQCSSSLSLRFLSTPVGVLGDDTGRIKGLQVEENNLILSQDGQSHPVGTGVFHTLDVDTVIFAIGDVVDVSMGLPVKHGEFCKNPQPRFPVEDMSYELFDPQANRPIPDVFLAGWARKPSVGLVGLARKDAGNSIKALAQYVSGLPLPANSISECVHYKLQQIRKPVVDKADLERLRLLEMQRATQLGVATFKFATNEEMLEALNLEAGRFAPEGGEITA